MSTVGAGHGDESDISGTLLGRGWDYGWMMDIDARRSKFSATERSMNTTVGDPKSFVYSEGLLPMGNPGAPPILRGLLYYDIIVVIDSILNIKFG